MIKALRIVYSAPLDTTWITRLSSASIARIQRAFPIAPIVTEESAQHALQSITFPRSVARRRAQSAQEPLSFAKIAVIANVLNARKILQHLIRRDNVESARHHGKRWRMDGHTVSVQKLLTSRMITSARHAIRLCQDVASASMLFRKIITSLASRLVGTLCSQAKETTISWITNSIT